MKRLGALSAAMIDHALNKPRRLIRTRRAVPLKTAEAALEALNDAAQWIAIGEEGTRQCSWFATNPNFDRRRRALRRAIEAARGVRS